MYMNLGGTVPGISVRQTANSMRNSEDALTRKVLRNAWNNTNVQSSLNGADGLTYERVVGPFRAANNLGDYLGRQNYVCGGPNPVGVYNRGGALRSNCDASGIQATSCNPKFVSDSSDYLKFKKQQAVVRNYNDNKFGGDASNGSYTALMRVRRK